MAITALGMAGIAGGQTLLNQGLGMINQDRQEKEGRLCATKIPIHKSNERGEIYRGR